MSFVPIIFTVNVAVSDRDVPIPLPESVTLIVKVSVVFDVNSSIALLFGTNVYEPFVEILNVPYVPTLEELPSEKS